MSICDLRLYLQGYGEIVAVGSAASNELSYQPMSQMSMKHWCCPSVPFWHDNTDRLGVKPAVLSPTEVSRDPSF